MIPSRTLTANRPHKSASTISTDTRPEASSPDSTGAGSGRVNGTPCRAARSRATPATDMASGRLGLTSRS